MRPGKTGPIQPHLVPFREVLYALAPGRAKQKDDADIRRRFAENRDMALQVGAAQGTMAARETAAGPATAARRCPGEQGRIGRVGGQSAARGRAQTQEVIQAGRRFIGPAPSAGRKGDRERRKKAPVERCEDIPNTQLGVMFEILANCSIQGRPSKRFCSQFCPFATSFSNTPISTDNPISICHS